MPRQKCKHILTIAMLSLSLAVPTIANAEDIAPQTKLLSKVVDGVVLNYLNTVSPDKFSATLIDNLNDADTKKQALRECEGQGPFLITDQKKPWLSALNNAVRCSHAIRGEVESNAALDAAVARSLQSLDAEARYLQKISPGRNQNEYWAPLPPRLHAGMVGVTVRKLDEATFEVVSVLPGGPAEYAGIEADDKIVKINGRPTSNMSLEDIFFDIQAPTGSNVDIALVGKSGEAKNVQVTTVASKVRPEIASINNNPEQFVPTTVRYEQRDGLLIIVIPRLVYDQTSNGVRAALKTIRKSPAPLKAIVLDLRTSGGGELEEAVIVADQFLDQGAIMKMEGRTIGSETISARSGSLAPNGMPIFILIGKQTGGASEVLASALIDSGRAKAIGQRTIGAGTIKTMELVSNNRAVSIPQGKLYRPNGQPLSNGILPDVDAEFDEATTTIPDSILTQISSMLIARTN